MGYVLPDLVIESVILDGIQNILLDPSIIDDVFSNLTKSFASKKYGDKEIDKIKKVLLNKEINIVHSFNLVPASLPCFSIQLSEESEDIPEARMGDYQALLIEEITDPVKLAQLVRVTGFVPTAYNPFTGFVSVADSVDLSQTYAGLIFVDGSGTEYTILKGISNNNGMKGFTIALNATVDLVNPAEIKSSLNYTEHKLKGNMEKTNLTIGVHTNDPLLTKYLYILLKYWMMSRKPDLISRDLQLSTYSGSDFTRNLEYGGNTVFTRFLHVSGLAVNSFRAEKVALIDNIEIDMIFEG